MRVPPKEYIMARFKLSNHDITMDEEEFRDILVETFQVHYRAIPTVDELVLRQRTAIRYCDHIREILFERGEAEAIDLPDDVILRTLMNKRKRG
jgi:hypothetical protein